MKKILSIILVFVMVFGVCASFGTTKAYGSSEDFGAKWMSAVPDDAYIANLNIPGTHDSAMYYTQLFTSEFGAQTQESTIYEQMQMGIRIFDLRLRYGGDNNLILCHGQGSWCCDAYRNQSLLIGGALTLEDVFNWACQFLNNNDQETLIMTLQHESEKNDAEEDSNTYWSSLEFWVKKFGDRIKIVSISELKNMKMEEARGFIIIPEKKELGDMGFGDLTNPGMNQWKQIWSEKWAAVKSFLDDATKQDLTGPNDFRAAYTSCTQEDATRWYPESLDAAKKIRAKLYDYNFQCGIHYGWISMDLANPKLARLIYESNQFSTEAFISEIRAFCGDEKDASDKEDWEEIREAAYEQGYTLVEDNFINVNPKGYNMALGYKLTYNPLEAITDIVGLYGFSTSAPSGYEEVLVDNAICNHLSNGSGSDSEYTYLYYTHKDGDAPISALQIVEGDGNVKVYKSKDSFNFEEGISGVNIGLNVIKQDQNVSAASILSYGMLNTIFCIIIAGLVVVIIILAKKLKDAKQ